MSRIPSGKEIRQDFIDFFLQRGHSFVPSSPVVPLEDPTLLFANAGMNQFKDVFLGQREPSAPRAVNSQKCIRAGGKHNDLEEVGADGYHHTFFEMLGNWSFADYYKEDAIRWAWELLTEIWKLPKNQLYATCHHSDEEAFEIWKKHTDIDPAHISFHGDKDNFWEMGETGPCGPCSEIHIDRGEGTCDLGNTPGHVCAVNSGCARFIELWNLVFIQYKREADRSLTPLKHRYVDTGAGLERITQVLQNKSSNYETDLFMPIIQRIAELSGRPYDPQTGTSHRVIADHVRCLCFALADGGFPSNEGRGYVMRRILRRAARHGRLLGFAEPFLYQLVDVVTDIMAHHFTELAGKQEYIRMVIKAEEERFNHTLDLGLQRFDEIRKALKGLLISGKDAFTLYDTFGFPLDLTTILASEAGLEVDLDGFADEMQQQRERARAASKFASETQDIEWIVLQQPTPTQFVGYTSHQCEAHIQRYYIDGAGRIHLQLDKTPFYAESGGQVADIGELISDGFAAKIEDVQKHQDYFIHIGRITDGAPHSNPLLAIIDSARRQNIARNHTVTHLLHKALVEIVGPHVQQKGSLVAPEYARFDFTHLKGLSPDEQRQLESRVNEIILKNLSVNTQILPIAEAKAQGAIALFGEKYEDNVRVVSVTGYSKELCGGTHVDATGEIGLFKILSESSIAAGIRRVEIITGNAAIAYVRSLQESLSHIASRLHTPSRHIEEKLDALLMRNKELEEELKRQSALQDEELIKELLSQAESLDGFRLLAAKIKNRNPEQLRSLGESLRQKAPDLLAFLFAAQDDRISIMSVAGSSLKERFHAGKLIGKIAAFLDGKGGGRPDSAMAGGKNPSRIADAINYLKEIIDQSQ